MIKLFKNVSISHDVCDDEFVKCLIGNDYKIFWVVLLSQNQTINLKCSPNSFKILFVTFFSNVLVQGKNDDIIFNLLSLYDLDYRLKNNKNVFIDDFDDLHHLIEQFDLDDVLLDIPKSDYSFEIMLANFLLSGEPKESILKYVKWSCWSLLSQELYMFAEDIKRDIFSGHHVVGKNINISNLDYISIYEVIDKDADWNFILNSRLVTEFDIDTLEESVDHMKSFFPDADSLIKIFNNHAIAHRDEQGIDSFREPIEMIYSDRYEELLFRDMMNNFRITYASDGLGKHLVCTFLSRIYYAFKTDATDKTEIYKMFELRVK
jgi:hypothetical protein